MIMDNKWQPDGVTCLTILNVVVLIIIFISINNKMDKLVVNEEHLFVAEVKSDIENLNFKLESLEKELNRTNLLMEKFPCDSRSGDTKTNHSVSKGDEGEASAWDPMLAAELEKLMENESVGEFEAGLGCYGRFFLRHKPSSSHFADRCIFHNKSTKLILLYSPQKISSWNGFDSHIFAPSSSRGTVKYVDLREPVYLEKKFHWVISFVINQPILEQQEKIFMSNLARHACKGIILAWSFSRSNHGSGGVTYIAEQMAQHGLIYDKGLTDMFRKKASLPIFKEKLIVMRQKKPRHCRTSTTDFRGLSNSYFPKGYASMKTRSLN